MDVLKVRFRQGVAVAAALVCVLAVPRPGSAEGAAPVQSIALIQPGWEQAMFPKATLQAQQVVLDEAARDAVQAKFGVAPPDDVLEWAVARDAGGKAVGGLIKVRVVYNRGSYTLAVGLNEQSRITRVVIPESSADIHADIEDLAPRGYVTRFTAASLPQVRSVVKGLQGREGLGLLVAEQTLRAAGALSVLLEAGR